MRQSSVVGAQRARPAFPRVQKTLAEGVDRNARCARRREKGCSEHESNRNCQTDRRPRARRYPEGDTPHNADTGGRPDTDNIDTRYPILVLNHGHFQKNWGRSRGLTRRHLQWRCDRNRFSNVRAGSWCPTNIFAATAFQQRSVLVT